MSWLPTTRWHYSGNQWRVRLAIATNDSITGTSTNTPTTVARAAPECNPNKEMATATASSKKFEVPINHASRRSNAMWQAHDFGRGVGNNKNAIGLDQQRNGNQHNNKRLGHNSARLKTK